jgi:hypothetical protein
LMHCLVMSAHFIAFEFVPWSGTGFGGWLGLRSCKHGIIASAASFYGPTVANHCIWMSEATLLDYKAMKFKFWLTDMSLPPLQILGMLLHINLRLPGSETYTQQTSCFKVAVRRSAV